MLFIQSTLALAIGLACWLGTLIITFHDATHLFSLLILFLVSMGLKGFFSLRAIALLGWMNSPLLLASFFMDPLYIPLLSLPFLATPFAFFFKTPLYILNKISSFLFGTISIKHLIRHHTSLGNHLLHTFAADKPGHFILLTRKAVLMNFPFDYFYQTKTLGIQNIAPTGHIFSPKDLETIEKIIKRKTFFTFGWALPKFETTETTISESAHQTLKRIAAFS